MKQENNEVRLEQVRRHRNVVVREVCDAQGNKMGIVVEPHDATEAGVIAAAQRATDRMYAEYPEASNIDAFDNLIWPHFAHYIWPHPR